MPCDGPWSGPSPSSSGRWRWPRRSSGGWPSSSSPSAGAGGRTVEAYLLAELAATSSEAAIARLGSEVWAWPGVDVVTFRFPGETTPAPVAGRSLLVRLLTPEARPGVEARLRALPEVVGVQYHERAARAQVPLSSRAFALVFLGATLALALGLGYRAVAGAERLWGRELALLRSCGVSPAVQRAPFFVLGGLWVRLGVPSTSGRAGPCGGGGQRFLTSGTRSPTSPRSGWASSGGASGSGLGSGSWDP